MQITGTILEACVLGILAVEDTYGYEITQTLRRVSDISESTLYPVLRRLQKENYLETYDMPHAGRNRRYYKLTDLGKERLVLAWADWSDYKTKVENLLFMAQGTKNTTEADTDNTQNAPKADSEYILSVINNLEQSIKHEIKMDGGKDDE